MHAHSKPTTGRKLKTLESSGPSEKPPQQSVRIYKPDELDHNTLATRTKAVLDKIAFHWQLEIGAAALCGEDVIVDVGTGCGKTLAFSIPLVLNKQMLL
jgi:superfamily II DNA/RNA helicase